MLFRSLSLKVPSIEPCSGVAYLGLGTGQGIVCEIGEALIGGKGGADRESTIAAARADMPGETVWIIEARRLVPAFDIFDAAQIHEQLQDDECWGENGWDGGHEDGPHAIDLEKRLAATLRRWFAECCDLGGAQLDFVSGPEEVPPA